MRGSLAVVRHRLEHSCEAVVRVRGVEVQECGAQLLVLEGVGRHFEVGDLVNAFYFKAVDDLAHFQIVWGAIQAALLGLDVGRGGGGTRVGVAGQAARNGAQGLTSQNLG